jgi:hypothetical protein
VLRVHDDDGVEDGVDIGVGVNVGGGEIVLVTGLRTEIIKRKKQVQKICNMYPRFFVAHYFCEVR